MTKKAIFNGAKVNDVFLVFNPATAFDNNEAELSSLLKIKKEEVADVKVTSASKWKKSPAWFLQN